jgi:hypothetical protein
VGRPGKLKSEITPEQESQSISPEQADLAEQIERRIFLIRGHKVLLDSDLAKFYGVSTGHLNERVRRNRGRFPPDFMFALSPGEAEALRSQIAISKARRGGRRYLPSVFTEQGVAMLSSVLNSERAIQVNIAIMRTFVRLRVLQATYKDLADQLEELRDKYDDHDLEIQRLIACIKELMALPVSKSRQIGFVLHQGKDR